MTDFNYTGAAISYTAPNAGIFTITAYGAQGGNRGSTLGGKGAEISGVFRLTANEVLTLAVGGAGGVGSESASGGGGSFIVAPGNVPLVVAGGGGGAAYRSGAATAGGPGLTTNDGGAGVSEAAGSGSFTGGAGGTGGGGGGIGSGDQRGGGGGGFLGNGSSVTTGNSQGGGAGGGGYPGLAGGVGNSFGGSGGFGGGGAGSYDGGGGGGGYSGGGGGGGSSGGGTSGGGGGSYINTALNTYEIGYVSTVAQQAGVRSGNGLIQITPANITGAGVVYLASNLDATFNPVFQGGTFRLDQAGRTIADAFQLDNSTTNTIDQAGMAATFTGVFSDLATGTPGNITVDNSGSGGLVVFSGANTYTGATTVSSGAVLKVANATALGSNSAVTDNGAIDLGEYSQTIGSLGGVGLVTSSSSAAVTLTTGALNATRTFSGVIQDGGGPIALTKVGTGTLTLSGADTFTGATTVTGGSLEVDGGYTSAVTVQSGATLQGKGTSTAAVTVAAGGRFSPGGTDFFTPLPIGAFTAASLALAGTFAENITGASTFGKAVFTSAAAGAVNLTGSNLTLTYTGGAEAYHTTYTILSETGGGTVTGAFSNAGSAITSNGHTFAIGYSAASVTLTDLTNTAISASNSAAAGQAITDKATTTPFAGVTVNDGGDTGETYSANIGFTAANGTLASGAAVAGTVVSGGNGAYTVTADTAAHLQQALQGLVFTPTANQVTPGQAQGTTFSVAISDVYAGAALSTANVTDTVAVTSANDAPVLAGSQGGQTVGDRSTINPFATVTVADPDVGQTETVTVTFTGANGALSGGGFAGANGVYTVTAASAADAQADLRAAVFTPTSAPIGAAATSTTFTVSVNDGAAPAAIDNGTQVTATHTTNTAPVLGGFTAGQTTNDKTAASPFAGVTVADPDAQTETVTVTLSAAANGALSGGGFTAVANSPGVYRVTAPDAATAQADLRALVFTPTPNQVAPGATMTTGFTVQVNDTQTTVQNTQTTEIVTSINDPAVFGGFQTAVGQASGTPALLQTQGLTVTDPDAGAKIASAFVSIVGGTGIAGDVLGVQGALPAGVTATYDAANYVLTLSSAAPLPDSTYAQALSQVTFVPNVVSNSGSRTVAFNVYDDQGVRTRSVDETVTVGSYIQPGVTGGGSGMVPTNLDVQQGFPTQFDNLTRAGASDAALQTPTSPLYTQAQMEKGIAAQLDSGQISLADAQSALFHVVDGTTSVAEISYAFFTGKTPTQAGLNYLVHSAANSNDLNDPYYAQFTTENRYINFANNLGTGAGAGAAAFQADYGSLSLSDATAKAYAAVFGVAAATDKVSSILNAQVSNGLGGTETRAQYLADITGGSSISQKAAVVGFLLADSVKEGFGTYQQADLHFLADLAHGTAVFNVDLLAAYAQAPALVGQAVVDPTLGG